jgi:tRNA(Ile2) C34 agmatinyltransferase TiaS
LCLLVLGLELALDLAAAAARDQVSVMDATARMQTVVRTDTAYVSSVAGEAGEPTVTVPVAAVTRLAYGPQPPPEAQCPRCGAYSVVAVGGVFRCSSCRKEWSVDAAEPWPDVVIRPELEYESSADRSRPG